MLLIEGSRYEYELKVLLNFFKSKDNYTEIKSYFDNNIKSSFRPIFDSIIVYSVFIRYCFFCYMFYYFRFYSYFFSNSDISKYTFIYFYKVYNIAFIFFILMKYNTFKLGIIC